MDSFDMPFGVSILAVATRPFESGREKAAGDDVLDALDRTPELRSSGAFAGMGTPETVGAGSGTRGEPSLV